MIISQLTGGMGNQMFQYAFGRYLAIKHNTSLFLDTSILLNHIPCGLTYYWYDLGIFNLASTIGTSNDFPQYTTKFHVKNIPLRVLHLLQLELKGIRYKRQSSFNFNERYHQWSNNSYLDGYWQSEKFFKPIESVIRSDFEFNFVPQGLAANMLTTIQSSNAICVHIRRGDYLRYIEHHGVVGNDYVQQGIEILAQKVPNATFFVFSNDIEWCKQHITSKHPMVYITPENAGKNDKEHFYLMTKCKHFVIANSTFSWWAAWLAKNNDKMVIAPKKWVLTSKIDTSDVIPDSWTML